MRNDVRWKRVILEASCAVLSCMFLLVAELSRVVLAEIAALLDATW